MSKEANEQYNHDMSILFSSDNLLFYCLKAL